ncbi:MAG: acylphosphatase [Bryobacteraceae bacterium]
MVGSRRQPKDRIARRYFVEGRVQGVGFRDFVEDSARELGLAGYTRNLADGRVEVYAIGPEEALDELESRLWRGPRMARVDRVERKDAPVANYSDFRIEYF